MKEVSNVEACAAYFCGDPGFIRLMQGMKEKYRSLGTVGGTVVLKNLKAEEKAALEGLMQKSYGKQKSTSISMSSLQRKLEQSRFAGVSLDDLVQQYFGGDLQTKKEVQEERSIRRAQFFQSIYEEYKGTFSGSWLQEQKEMAAAGSADRAWKYLMRLYQKESRDSVYQILKTAMDAGNQLPVFRGEKERLPVFAARIAGDPHALDDGTAAQQVMMYLMEYYLKQQDTVWFTSGHYETESRNELYYQVGLLKDDLMNFTMAQGIVGIDKKGNPHRGMTGYEEEQEPMILTLHLLSQLSGVSIKGRDVFVVENSGVFAELVQRTRGCHAAVVCTGGQLKLASLVLLDLLQKSGARLYYAGDFDPEGISIAQRLVQRYGNDLILWHYEKADYERCRSNKKISSERIKKMDTLTDPVLLKMCEWIVRDGCAGYQEHLLEEYGVDIENAGIIS